MRDVTSPAARMRNDLGVFLIGAITTLFTGRNALFAGSRQAGIGLLAAAVTYATGRLLGVAVGG
jgi:VIT1/CCC1 family predicted Fe2+/Mn2+ transporter